MSVEIPQPVVNIHITQITMEHNRSKAIPKSRPFKLGTKRNKKKPSVYELEKNLSPIHL